jgi:uncharacterized membrane protein YjfL (UPF0719 family)
MLMALFSTVLFGCIGIVMTIAGYKLFDLITHVDLHAEICEKQNIAVAILCTGMILGIAIVVAASVL